MPSRYGRPSTGHPKICGFRPGRTLPSRPRAEKLTGTSSQVGRNGRHGLPGITAMAKHRLLVVEDDSASQDAYRQFYSRSGWEVRVAGTVGEALSLLDADTEPCCLILDLHLPDGDGVDVLRRVRDKGLKTRVAVCTGSVDLARLKAASELKPDDML